jgi:hypothetical protein
MKYKQNKTCITHVEHRIIEPLLLPSICLDKVYQAQEEGQQHKQSPNIGNGSHILHTSRKLTCRPQIIPKFQHAEDEHQRALSTPTLE